MFGTIEAIGVPYLIKRLSHAAANRTFQIICHGGILPQIALRRFPRLFWALGMGMERLTREDFDKWITPMEALAILRAAFGDPHTNPRETMRSALMAGLVLGVAGRTSRYNGKTVQELEPIPPKAWENIRTTDDVWTTSHTTYGEQLTSRAYGPTTVTVSAFEVRFHLDAVRKLVPKSSMPPMPPTPTATWESLRSRPRATPQQVGPKFSIPELQKPKGGRPRKDFWEDLYIDVGYQIYIGDLKPKTQADVQRAMEQWVSDHGHEAGETVMKAAAKKLFLAWKLGVGN